ncbi:uncharacterized protein J4E79_011195 [Alternaria viburni]|uniref:uncharacterized protein n=1 Tax=Alternaria viburni TaxID=566460 RepID=UPI0020C2F8C7|nr:uncharacterized protein J4E79_011195 [Alternaria viburni]KAI4643923.1 hypothetical protein J4E79_011195 [Alternaria viburni]
MEGGFETEYEQDLLAEYKDLIDLDIQTLRGINVYFLEARLLGLRLVFASKEDEESEEDM